MPVVKDLNAPPAKEVANVVQEPRAAPEADFADDLLKAQEKMIRNQFIARNLAGFGMNSSGGESSEMLKVAKEAFDMQANVAKSLSSSRQALEEDLLRARKEQAEAQANVFKLQLDIIKIAESRIQEKAQELAANTSGRNDLAIYKEVKQSIDAIVKDTNQSLQNVVSQPPAQDAQYELEKMKLNFDFQKQIEEMRQTAEKNNKEWDLRMRQFDEDNKRNWAKFESESQMKKDAVGGFQDLMASLQAGISGDMGEEIHPNPGAGKVKSQVVTEEVPDMVAEVSQFKCQVCQTMIKVNPGDTVVTCTNPDCETEYNIKKAG